MTTLINKKAEITKLNEQIATIRQQIYDLSKPIQDQIDLVKPKLEAALKLKAFYTQATTNCQSTTSYGYSQQYCTVDLPKLVSDNNVEVTTLQAQIETFAQQINDKTATQRSSISTIFGQLDTLRTEVTTAQQSLTVEQGKVATALDALKVSDADVATKMRNLEILKAKLAQD